MEAGDPFEPDDAPTFRLPPPPDDRLWRHPSELGAPVGAPPPAAPRRSAWLLAVVSGLTGAVLTVGLLAATGSLSGGTQTREAVVREAVRPATLGAEHADTVVRVAAAVAPVIVRLEVRGEVDSVGSGVLFRDDGHVLTNAHVVDRARSVTAVLADGRAITGEVVGSDTATDIAVVKLDEAGPYPTALLGSTDGIAVGQLAIAIGSPLGLSGSPSVTTGVVSALGREIEARGGRVLLDMIQTDAAIAAGSSGGALVDADGAVIGITTAYTPNDSSAALGFATPVDVARAVAEDLLLVGHVRVVWLGVRGDTSSDGDGIDVDEVADGSPAAAAGLRRDDVIRRIDGHPVATMSALRVSLRRRHPGDHVRVEFERAGKARAAEVVLGERQPE